MSQTHMETAAKDVFNTFHVIFHINLNWRPLLAHGYSYKASYARPS